MKTVIITRKYWGTHRLLNANGTMCCLGFCSKKFGIKPKKMLDVALPDTLNLTPEEASLLPSWFREVKAHGGETDVEEASSINDSIYYSWEQKEKALKELFAKHQIKLIFRGKR